MGRKHNVFVEEADRVPRDRKLTRPGANTIVLLNPRIPQNTGSIARMCAATGSRLELVNPFFRIDDAKLKRAGLDYWPLLDVRVFADWPEWKADHPGARPWLVEVASTKIYTAAEFAPESFLVFGDEQDGIADSVLAEFPDRHVMIPQVNVRSMNLAMCVGVVTFEALRQQRFVSLGY